MTTLPLRIAASADPLPYAEWDPVWVWRARKRRWERSTFARAMSNDCAVLRTLQSEALIPHASRNLLPAVAGVPVTGDVLLP